VTGRRLSWWLPLVAASATILVRVPFLLRPDALFDSDEAVEGLMARHLHEWPVFLWGQGYKGVPEVYLAGLVFAIFGVGVVPLKAATLGVWAVAVALTTRLGERWYGSVVGGLAGAFLALGPPSLIYWSVCASAEVAWLTLIFAAVLLAYERSFDSAENGVSPLVFVGCGAALWIHPNAIAFVGALGLVAAFRSRWWQEHRWRGLVDLALARNVRGGPRVAVLGLHAVVALLAATFVVTYFGGRLQAGIVTASHPQKVFGELGVVSGLAVVAHALAGGFVARRRALAAMGWFALGLAPVWFELLRGGARGFVISERTVADAPHLAAVFVTGAFPIFIGVKDTVGSAIVPWWAAIPFMAAIAAHVAVTGREWFGAVGPSRVLAGYAAVLLFLVFVPGGAFQDVLSYRYMMPFFALVALTAASGIHIVGRRTRVGAGLLAVASLAAFAVEDVRFLRKLGADDSKRRLIACLHEQGVRAATAEYWLAYTITFLTDERLIVNPDRNARYRPYADAVDREPSRVHVQRIDGPAEGRRSGQVICTAPPLEAVQLPR
jgi:hypothetical protein